VRGQYILKANSISPSAKMNPTPIQVYMVILSKIPAYKIEKMITTKKIQISV
jgi:hypothetical protein